MKSFKLLLAPLFLFAAARTASAACPSGGDTTLNIPALAPGATYNPAPLNAIASGCSDSSTLTININYPGDTLRLSSAIIIAGRLASSSTHLVGQGSDGSPVTVTEGNASSPEVLRLNNRTQVSNFNFVRKAAASANNNTNSVNINAKGSVFSNCQFHMLENASTGTGAMLNISQDSVLVERCFFRSPPDGKGRGVAIKTESAANKVEIRSNIFYSMGLYLSAGTFHVYANTFAGSRDDYNAIIVGSGVSDPVNGAVIQHNLFALKADTLPPVFFSSAVAGVNQVLKNAYSRSKDGLAIAVNGSGTPVTLGANHTGSNMNVVLPKGYSNYGPTSGEFKEYPLIQLRTDPTLARGHADFGRIPSLYNANVSNWTTIPDVSAGLPASAHYFPQVLFLPFNAGKTWEAGIKVGALVDLENRRAPSPLAAGSAGASLRISRHPSDSTRMRVTGIDYDTTYYGAKVIPASLYFFFSTNQAKLTASNDSIALKASVGAGNAVKRDLLGFDSSLVVPKEVRTGGPIHVKLLHFNADGQAPVISPLGGIATVTGIPPFPVNDLAVQVVQGAGTDTTTGKFRISVTKSGAEDFDSVVVTAVRQGGSTITSQVKARPNQGQSITFDFLLGKDLVSFQAAPRARVGAEVRTGTTVSTRFYNSQQLQSDSVWVKNTGAPCPGALGTAASPFCSIDDALAAVSGGGTIIVQNNTPTAVPFQNVVIGGTDSAAVTLVAAGNASGFDPAHRAVIRGSAAQEALLITRGNVTVRGLILEMPAGAASVPALSVKAPGVTIDGCIFRPTTAAKAEGVAAHLEAAASKEIRFINNIVWGFGTAVRIASASNAIRVLHNTFIEEPGVNAGSTGISGAGTPVAAAIANNYFSGVSTALAADLAGSTPILDRNAFTTRTPALQGIAELAAVDSVARLAALDLTAATFLEDFKTRMDLVVDCNSLSENGCNGMYAGASTANYGPQVTTDVTGKARVGRLEIGALESEFKTDRVRGILKTEATAPSDIGDTNIVFHVTALTYDPADPDSVYVWWSVNSGDNKLDKVPIGSQRKYPAARLAEGGIIDTARGLSNVTRYYVFAAMGRTTGGVRNLGPAYWDTATTTYTRRTEDCRLSMTSRVCPESGFFSVTAGPATGLFLTSVTFAQSDTGYVAVPEFTYGQTTVGKVDINSPQPQITLNIDSEKLKDAGSGQSWTASIEFVQDPGSTLDGKDLFLLPNDPTGLPAFVPTWRIRRESGKVYLDIDGTSRGVQKYAFGNASVTAEGGKLEPAAAAEVPVFSLKDVEDTASVALTVAGSGFITSNPLVMVTPMPAGGTYKDVFANRPNPSLLLSSGLSELAPGLRLDRFHRYLAMAAAYDTNTPPPAGTNKPFTLTAADTSLLKSRTRMDLSSLSLSGAGEAASLTLNLPLDARFKDPDYYDDKIGKSTRSLEVVFTVFDGGRINRTSAYIRTEFAEPIQTTEKKEFERRQWNLFAYPWEEADTGSYGRIFAPKDWSAADRRLMRYKGAGAGPTAFVAYDGSNNDAVPFDAGRAAWSASVDFYTPVTATGKSLDYRPFTLALAADQWNDIGLPFNFPIKWQDVLNASGFTDLLAYRYDPKAKGWSRLTRGEAANQVPQSVLHPWEGFTVRPAAGQTSLVFPVTDSSRSATPMLPAAKAAVGAPYWAARVEAWNPTATVNLRIGMADREYAYSEPPDVPGQDFRIAFRRMGQDGEEKFAELLQGAEKGWQGHWSLSAEAPKEGIRLRVAENPRGIPIHLVETLGKRVVTLEAGTEVALTGEELMTGDYHIVAGDSRYLSDVLKGLVPLHMLALSNYPNPFSGSTLIRYALPESFGKVTFRMRIRDSRGRLVWEKVQKGSNALRHLWDGRDNAGAQTGAGFYTLTVEATAPGKATQRAVRRLLKM